MREPGLPADETPEDVRELLHLLGMLVTAADHRVRAQAARMLPHLFADEPAPAKPLLESLLDDPSARVRTAVADALRHLAEIDADLALTWAEEWAGEDPTDLRRAMLRHGLRNLRSAGNARAFRVTDRVDYQR